jgi:hypothetical protein
MKFFRKSIVLLILLVTIFNCNVVQKEKKDNTINTILAFIVYSFIGTGGSCSITVLRSGRNSTASANPVLITSTEKSITYSRVPVVTHSIGIAQISNASQGDKFQFNTIDVADFDGDQTSSLPLVYKTSECPVLSTSLITTSSEASSVYTRAVSGSTYTYTINTAGNYSFVLYQLIYPPTASTVKKL